MNKFYSLLFVAIFIGAVFATTQTVTVTIYDHYPTISGVRYEPDFQPASGTFDANVDKGMVCSNLTQYGDQITYIAPSTLKDGVTNASTFATWFNYVPGVTIPLAVPLAFTVTQPDPVNSPLLYNYAFSSDRFFPIDGQGWCNTTQYPSPYNCAQYKDDDGKSRNFHFCFHWSAYWQYLANLNQQFKFTGDDDVWVYFNKQLEIDIGGIHNANSATFIPKNKGTYVDGQTYYFDFFYCERKTTGSNIMINTNIKFLPSYTDYCGVDEGTGTTCCQPEKTCNDNNPCTNDACPPGNTKLDPSKFPAGCIYTNVTCPAVSSNKCYDKFLTCDASKGGCPASNWTADPCPALGNKCQNYLCKDKTIGCQSFPVKCQDSDSCYNYACDPDSGSCIKSNTTVNTNCGVGQDKCMLWSCSPTQGCVSTPRPETIPGPCQTITCNPTTGAITTTAIPGCTSCCNSTTLANLCNTYSCNAANQCVATPKTGDSDLCTTQQCTPATGLFTVTSTVSCTSTDFCVGDGSCEPTTGSCVAGPANTCSDGNACTIDSCDSANKTCNYTPLVCDDNNDCTIDSCDPLSGCVHTLKSCPSSSLCLEGYCSGTSGVCDYRPVTCPTDDFCQVPVCNSNVGCVNVPRDCVAENPDCASSTCNTATQSCDDTPFSPLPFKCQSAAVKTGVAVGAAATAGIVIGGAVALALGVFGGKKGYDYWKQTQHAKMSAATNNPLYEASHNVNENPLFEGGNA